MRTQSMMMPMVVMRGIMMRFTPFLLAMEHQEVHTEAIEGCHKHADDDRVVGIVRKRQVAGMDRLNDRILRVEA